MLCFLVAWSLAPVFAADPGDDVESYLSELSLEELMELEVTSVSRKGESLGRAAAAVTVLTGDDLRRSGVMTLADALRLVPGMQVARIDASSWAVSARGFNNRFSNKLLVLIDGRTVYTPDFSGVYWDAQDLPLDLIERIEIVRGPGGTLWGANAVNGVINVITRVGADEDGGTIDLGLGTEQQFLGLRYGRRIDDDLSYRVYARGSVHDDLVDAGGADAGDGWDQLRAGFRIDASVGDRDRVTVQGDLYDGQFDRTLIRAQGGLPAINVVTPFTGDASGHSLLARWDRDNDDDVTRSLQIYLNRTERNEGFLTTEWTTLDLDLQQRRRFGDRHELVWGVGYRLSLDTVEETPFASTDDDPGELSRVSAFVQDELSFRDDRLRLVLGAKFEHNSYTGVEVQPNVRFAWHPDDRRTLWASVSRGVRTPSRASADLTINVAADPTTGALVRLEPNPDIDSEELLAFELGYRSRLSKRVSFDVAAFRNEYDELEVSSLGAPVVELAPPQIVVPIRLVNGGKADTYGLEIMIDCRPTERWRLLTGATLFEMDQQQTTAAPSLGFRDSAEDNPASQLFIRSSHDIGSDWELDAMLRYVDELPEITRPLSGREAVEDYVELDLRVARRVGDRLELELIGRDLLDGRHLEFLDSSRQAPATFVERSVVARAKIRF